MPKKENTTLVPVKPCTCNAYKFPHRPDSGHCGQVRQLQGMLREVGISLSDPAAVAALETHGRNPYEAASDVVQASRTRDEASVWY